MTADRELAAVEEKKNRSRHLSSSHMNIAPFVSRRAGGKDAGEVIDKGMVLPFQPLCLTFRHMDYYVPMPAVSLPR